MELDKIPGLAEALAKVAADEAAIRDLPFYPGPQILCGLECQHLALCHLQLLFAARSPFFFGGNVGAEHVAQFLLILAEPADRAAFLEKIATELDFETAVDEIEEYLETVFYDSPASGKRTELAITSMSAAFVDVFASEYKWDDDAILQKPLARLYQYLRQIARRNNPRAPLLSKMWDRTRRLFIADHLTKHPKQPKQPGGKKK